MQVIGKVKVVLDGDALRSEPGATLNLGLIKRTAMPNALGGVDYMEEFTNSEVKCTLLHVSDTDLEALERVTAGNVQFVGDNGVTYVIPDAFFAEAGEITSEGKVEVTFQGSRAIRQ